MTWLEFAVVAVSAAISAAVVSVVMNLRRYKPYDSSTHW